MFRIKVVEKIETFCMFGSFFSENRAVYETVWKNIVEPDEPQIIWRMPFAYCIHETTNIHAEYETFLAFPLQHWLQECPSMLTYTACLS